MVNPIPTDFKIIFIFDCISILVMLDSELATHKFSVVARLTVSPSEKASNPTELHAKQFLGIYKYDIFSLTLEL